MSQPHVNHTAAAAALTGAAAAVVDLGRTCLAFGRVDRITRHPDGVTAESDTTHTVMLGVIAAAFAARYLPQLDLGLVAQFALVHDLVEVYAGDTPTLRHDDAAQRAKERREAAAQERLYRQFGQTLPWVAYMIAAYLDQDTAEARYLRVLDKVVPKVCHLLNAGATFRAQGLSVEEVAARYARQADELAGYAADFPPLLALRAELVEQVLACYRTTAVST